MRHELMKDLKELRHVGGWALWNTQVAGFEQCGFADRERVDLARLFAARLDSRPTHRRALGAVAWHSLMDLELARKSFEVAARQAPYRFGSQGALAESFNKGAAAALKARARSRTQTMKARLRALFLLSVHRHIDDAAHEAALRGLLAERPDHDTVLKDLIEFLCEDKRHDEAVALTKRWLSEHARDARGLGEVMVRLRLARELREAGRFEEAWAILEPALVSRLAS